MEEGAGDGTGKVVPKLSGDPKIAKLMFELRVMNQVIYMHPKINNLRTVSCSEKMDTFAASQVTIRYYRGEDYNY